MSVIDLIISLVGAFVVQTLFDLSEPLSRRLVRVVCRLLPEEIRLARQEQMEADLLHINGSALRIVTAIGFVKIILPEVFAEAIKAHGSEATTVLSFGNMHNHGEMFAEYLRARRLGLDTHRLPDFSMTRRVRNMTNTIRPPIAGS